jgi:Tfp pilus assembly protein FimT
MLRAKWSCYELGGFGLTELVVAVACMSLLVGVAVPNLHRLTQEWNLWGAAHLLESALQWGRMYAISANTSVVLQIDHGGARFYWADPRTRAAYESSIRNLPAGVRIVSSPRRPLRFFPRGNAAPAGTIVVRGKAGQYRVVVNPAGRIRVQRE